MQPIVTDAEIAQDRAEAEARMRDTYVFERPTGATATDENDSDVPVYAPIHTTKGRLSNVDGQPRESEAGARTTVSSQPELHTPVESTPEIKPGDRVRCTVAGPGTDPDITREVFYVISTPIGSQKTARRWPLRRWEA